MSERESSELQNTERESMSGGSFLAEIKRGGNFYSFSRKSINILFEFSLSH